MHKYWLTPYRTKSAKENMILMGWLVRKTLIKNKIWVFRLLPCTFNQFYIKTYVAGTH